MQWNVEKLSNKMGGIKSASNGSYFMGKVIKKEKRKTVDCRNNVSLSCYFHGFFSIVVLGLGK